MTDRFSRTLALIVFVFLTIPPKRFPAMSSSFQGIPAR